jgi:uncharacterized peroxidase-related enzyme
VHHRRGLRRLLGDDALLARVEVDFERAGLDSRRLAILRYARRLTLEPARVERALVDAMRAEGLNDRDVLQVAEVTAYYAYVNRIADGLGVELEAPEPDGLTPP